MSNVTKSVYEAFRHGAKFTTLQVDPKTLSDSELQALYVGLVNDDMLTTLDFNPNDEYSLAVQVAAQALRSNNTLKCLSVSCNRLDNDGLTEIGTAVALNTSLKTLNLSRCCICLYQLDGMRRLCKAFESNTSISTLFIRQNYFGTTIGTEIGRMLASPNALRILDVSYNPLSDNGMVPIGRALARNSTLTALYMSDCRAGAVGMQAVAEGLEQNSALTDLGLRGCQCDADSMAAMSSAISINTVLRKLDLGRCMVTTDDMCLFAASLAKNSSLTFLELPYNRIGPECAAALGESLAVNTTLTTLWIGGNRLGSPVVREAAKSLRSNTTLVYIDLSENNVDCAGAAELGETLALNTTIRHIDLSCNAIASKGARALAHGIAANTKLTSLDLRSTCLETDDVRMLGRALEKNTTLTNLYVGRNPDVKRTVTEQLERFADANKKLAAEKSEFFAKFTRCHVRACRENDETTPLCSFPRELVEVVTRNLRHTPPSVFAKRTASSACLDERDASRPRGPA